MIFVLSYCVIEGIFSIINRIIRHSNIATKGWPPEHLDADGDWKEESDE